MIRRTATTLALSGLLALLLSLMPPAVGSNSLEEGAARAPAAASSRGLIHQVAPAVAAAQRELNRTLSLSMRKLQSSPSPGALLIVMLVAFWYGVIHAAGPGHGKMVISSFFLARDARWGRAIVVGGVISLLQVASAIAIVSLLALILERAGREVVKGAAWVELASYGLIALAGLYMAVRAITGHGPHPHGPVLRPGGADRADRRANWGLVVATGLTPCTSAIVLMLFALANGLLAIGIGATIVMAVGIGVTLSVVGVATIAARRTVTRAAALNSRAARWVGRGLVVAGPVLITAVSCLFFANAWDKLH